MDDLSLLGPLFEQLETMWVGFVKLLPMLGIAFVVLLFTWIASRIVKFVLTKVMDKAHMRPSLQSLIFTLAKIGVWTFGTLIALTIVLPSLTPAKILAGLGLGSIAIGFAFQDIFENFLAGVMIMLRKPMRIGDFIKCEGIEGKIEQINIRDTFVRQTDGQLVLVPNSMLFKNEVFVRTDQPIRRFEIICGVAYDEDLAQSKSVIQKAVESIEGLASNKKVEVYATEFNSSSVDFRIRWWAESKPLDEHKTRDQVVMKVKKALDDAGIEIPFPYRTLTFKEDLTINKKEMAPQKKETRKKTASKKSKAE